MRMVGVVISTRYGGSFGWAIPRGFPEARVRMDPRLVEAVRKDDLDGIEAACGRFGIPPERLRGVTLGVHFVPEGTKFVVQEYAGMESVVPLDRLPIMEAS